MDLNQLTEHIQNAASATSHKHDVSDQNAGYISVMLICLSFLFRLAIDFIQDYDYWFKALSLVSLGLVCLVNCGKLVEQIIVNINKVINFFKKK